MANYFLAFRPFGRYSSGMYMSKKYVRKMISLPEETWRRGAERAELFNIKFSPYLANLIQEDYRSGRRMMTIVAEDSPKDRKFLEKHPPML
jgi:hypothetical protein